MINLTKSFSLLILLLLLIPCQPLSAQGQKEENGGENPIGNFFRGLNKEVRDGAKEIEDAKQGRDQLDSRPPQNQDFERRLEQAKTFLEQSRFHDAVEILQYLNGIEEDFFFFGEKQQLVPAHSEVSKLLANLPGDAKRNYLNRFGPVAMRERDIALAQGDLKGLNKVSRLYVATQGGQSAAYTAALSLFDQGHLVAASRAFEELAHNTDTEQTKKRFAMRAISSAALAGDAALVQQIAEQFSISLEEITFLPTSIVSGREEFNDASTQLVSSSHQLENPADPQFLPIWTQRTIDRYDVEHQVKKLFSDLKETNRAIVTTSQAVLSGNIIAYRTLRALEVRNLQTGELLWENRAASNIETQFSQSASDDEIELRYRGRVPEHHPVTSLMLRDAISRSLTTDGRHLFAIEGHEVISSTSRGYAWQRRTTQKDPEDEKFSTNEIVAYDFKTGRVRWRLGGKLIEDPFSRPLAGTFFFGPPVSDGSDLFVIGERDGLISLFSLNPQTGEVLWSQELATPSRSLVDDQVRRFWPCYPSIQDGIIVCPTTCGWLVAVDRSSHQLLWASRFSTRSDKRQRSRGGFAVQSVQNLNHRWMTAPPVVVGNSVLVTPHELPNEYGSGELASICFDLRTGEELWRQAKGDGLYLAGVDGENAIFVGGTSVIARNIEESGRLVWKTQFSVTSSRPSGRSIILDRHLFIPVEGDQLVEISLEKGELVSTKKLASSEIQLGHLYYGEDQLISLSAFDLSAFPVRKLSDEEQMELERTFVSEVVAIEFLLSNNKYVEARHAIQELRSLRLFQEVSAQQQIVVDQLEWDSIEQIILNHEDLAEETLLEMQTLANTPTELMRYKRLAADYQLKMGEWKTALQLYLSLLDHAEILNHYVQTGTRKVRYDVWAGGRIQDLLEARTDEQRAEAVQQIASQFTSIEGSLGRSRTARVFHFLSLGQQLELDLALDARKNSRTSESLIRLQRVTNSPAPELASVGWSEMADILTELKSFSDAKSCWEQVLNRPDVPLSAAGTSHAVAVERLAQLKAHSSQPSRSTSWGDEWETVRTGTQGREDNLAVIEPVGQGFEFVNQFRWLFQNQHQRLRIENARTGEFVGSFPLRSMSNSSHRSNVGLRYAGSMSYAVHRGAIHALHFPDQQVAWTYTPSVSGLAMSRLRSPSQRVTNLLSNVSTFRGTSNLNSYTTPTGILLTANEYCALAIDEEIHALDALTGELLWTEEDASRRAIVEPYADRFILTADAKSHFVRMLDGKQSTQPLPDNFPVQCLQIDGTESVQLIRSDDEKRWDLQRGAIEDANPKWSIEIPADVSMIQFDDQALGYLTPEGELSLIDLRDGTKKLIGEIPAKLMKIQKRVYSYSDDEFIFLIVSHGTAKSTYVNLPSLKAAGTLLTFSKEGGLLWSQSTQELSEFFDSQAEEESPPDKEEEEQENENSTVWGMNLIVKEIRQSPVLIFISSRPENRDKVYFRRLTMIGFDKRTGKRVFDWSRISNSGGFSYLHVNTHDRYIDMRTYNERLKIQPVQPVDRLADGAGK